VIAKQREPRRSPWRERTGSVKSTKAKSCPTSSRRPSLSQRDREGRGFLERNACRLAGPRPCIERSRRLTSRLSIHRPNSLARPTTFIDPLHTFIFGIPGTIVLRLTAARNTGMHRVTRNLLGGSGWVAVGPRGLTLFPRDSREHVGCRRRRRAPISGNVG
jgi:hypothetical protein